MAEVREIVVVFLKQKQKQLMARYEILESIQMEHSALWGVCQKEMDRVDWNAELIRRKIYELEEED